MTYKIYKKENGVTTTEYKGEDEFKADVIFNTMLEFAAQSDWLISDLANGRKLLKRGDERMQLWTSWTLRTPIVDEDGAPL